MSRITDIRVKTEDELNSMLLDLRREQFNLRFQRATGQAEGTARIRTIRRDIARIKTVQHANQLKAASAAAQS